MLGRILALSSKKSASPLRSFKICGLGTRRLVPPNTDLSVEELFPDPSKYVSGVTLEDLKDRDLAEYFMLNFGQRVVDERNNVVRKSLRRVHVAPPLNIRDMHCYIRDPMSETGSRASAVLRSNGFIPGVLCGDDPTKGIKDLKYLIKTPMKFVQGGVDRDRWHFESRVFRMTLHKDEQDKDGILEQLVTPRDVLRHPLNDWVYSANFLTYFPGRPIKIPIKYINQEESPAMKKHGFIVPINKFIECVVDEGVTIPTHVDLRCDGLRLKDKAMFDRLEIPDGVRPAPHVNTETFLIGPVQGSSRDIDEGGAAEGEEEAEEEE